MLPYDMNSFKREFIKKKTPEKEVTPDITFPIEITSPSFKNDKIDMEKSRSLLLKTITSNVEPAIVPGYAMPLQQQINRE